MSNDTQAGVPAEWVKPWYRWHRLPLLPSLILRPETKWDVSHFHFNWLFLHVWDISSPDVGLGFELTDQDFWFRIRLPYLIIHFSLPLFPRAIYQKSWRTKPMPRPGE